MPEELRRRAALIAAALSITLIAGVAVAWTTEPPAARRLASGAQAGHRLGLLGQAPPADHPPLLPSPPSAGSPAATAPPEPSRLESFDACGELLGWIRGTAERLVTPYGLPGQARATPVSGGVAVGGGAGSGSASGGGGAARGGDAAESPPATSATNLQEAGVDEPDIAKHSGELLVAVAPAGIHVVHVAAQPPRLLATIPLPRGWGHELLLRGSRLLVTSHAHDETPTPDPAPGARFAPQPGNGLSTLLTTYDLADPASPRLLGELRLDGALVSSREHDGLVRVVVRSSPAPTFVTPRDGSAEAERAALERNREIVRNSSLGDWLPAMHAARPGATSSEASLPPCARVLRTDPAQNLDMVSVVTVSLAAPLRPLGATSVVGTGDIVYATASRVFVTHHIPSPSPSNWPDTGIHAFDTSDPNRPRHVGSAAVAGLPLNQWALSEHRGHLRVATTEFRTDGSSESAMHVLAIGDGVLREVGVVGGLGKGERIFAVRYDGDAAYVVTFRQTDPLYTLDLSDPARPQVLGELKIPGFSRYLHPIGEGLLLGIGQDADEDGRQRGLQVSVFDVRDPAKPRRLSQVAFGENSHSAAEHDHHALLWWAPLRRLVMPLSQFGSPQEGGSKPAPFDGAVSVAVDGQGQAFEAARLDTRQEGAQSASVRRLFARGDAVLALTDGALIVAGMDRMETRSRLDFPRPAGHDQPQPQPGPAGVRG